MYNRYIRNERGDYTRVAVPDLYDAPAFTEAPPPPPPEPVTEPMEPMGEPDGTVPPPSDPTPYGQDSTSRFDAPPRPEPDFPHDDPPPPPDPPVPNASRFIGQILKRLRLQNVDTGDILLLLILFFLFEEKADDELLIALGLLLIL